MAPQSKSLTKGISAPNIFLILCSIGMVVVSIVLLTHYFEVFFPKGLEASTVCDVSGFFSCDQIAFDPISTIFTIPISSFGILVGLFLFVGSFISDESLEGTNHFLVRLNFAGCLALFIYSLTVIRHLCPYCTLYYIFSTIAFILFYKYSSFTRPTSKILITYGVIAFIFFGVLAIVIYNKKQDQSKDGGSYISSFDSLANLGDPQIESPLRNSSSTKKFADSPIRVTIMSDFQCPYCGVLGKMMNKLDARYRGQINIQFFPWPLDGACNPNVTGGSHYLSCKASYLAFCLKDDFVAVHDQIFEMERSLTDSWLDKFAKARGVYECIESEKTRASIIELIQATTPFNINSTPSLLVNGRKIQGARPLPYFYTIFDELLKRNKSKK